MLPLELNYQLSTCIFSAVNFSWKFFISRYTQFHPSILGNKVNAKYFKVPPVEPNHRVHAIPLRLTLHRKLHQ